MSKLRVFFVISPVIFGVLLVCIFLWPIVSGEKYSEVSCESIIRSEDELIIDFDIINRESKDTDYIVN